MFTVSKTFQTVTPESAEHGDYADSGYEFEDQRMSLREVLREMERTGIVEPSCYPLDIENFAKGRAWFSTWGEGDVDYRTGEETTYALHIDASERNLRRLFKFYAARYPRKVRG